MEQKERGTGPVKVMVQSGVQVYLPDNGRDVPAITYQERMKTIPEADPGDLEFLSQKRLRELHRQSAETVSNPDDGDEHEILIIGEPNNAKGFQNDRIQVPTSRLLGNDAN